MIHILDTDVYTLSLLHDSAEYLRLEAQVAQLPNEDKIVTTVITYEEQTRGWLAYAAKSSDLLHQIKAYRRLKQHLLNYLQWDILDFDEAAAQEFQHLRSLKLRVGSAGLKIAAITLSCDGILLSRNLKDFTKVPNLRVEDWTKP
jgi:tRNA(fMet)-specific endonuclease VapC